MKRPLRSLLASCFDLSKKKMPLILFGGMKMKMRTVLRYATLYPKSMEAHETRWCFQRSIRCFLEVGGRTIHTSSLQLLAQTKLWTKNMNIQIVQIVNSIATESQNRLDNSAALSLLLTYLFISAPP